MEHSTSPTLAKFAGAPLYALEAQLCAIGAELDSLPTMVLPPQPSTHGMAVGNRSTPLLGAMETLSKESGEAFKALEEARATDTSPAAVSGSVATGGHHTTAVVNDVFLDGRDGNWLPTSIRPSGLSPPAAVATMNRRDDVIATEESKNPSWAKSKEPKETAESLYYKQKLLEGSSTGQYRSKSGQAAGEHGNSQKSPVLCSSAPSRRRRSPQNSLTISTSPRRQQVTTPGYHATSLTRSSARSTTLLIDTEAADGREARGPALVNLVKRPRLIFLFSLVAFSVLSFYCSYAVASFFFQNTLTGTDIPAAGEGLTIAPGAEGASLPQSKVIDERIAAGSGSPHAIAAPPKEDDALNKDERVSLSAQHVYSKTAKNLST